MQEGASWHYSHGVLNFKERTISATINFDRSDYEVVRGASYGSELASYKHALSWMWLRYH